MAVIVIEGKADVKPALGHSWRRVLFTPLDARSTVGDFVGTLHQFQYHSVAEAEWPSRQDGPIRLAAIHSKTDFLLTGDGRRSRQWFAWTRNACWTKADYRFFEQISRRRTTGRRTHTCRMTRR